MDLSDHNEGQRAAITAGGGPHLVIAGAGTGKTRTLTHRVAWLIEHGVAPQQIVLLTFTRRAAREMLERVAKISGPEAHYVRGGTFHGFALTALRRHADAIGYPEGFTILDRGDAEALVGLCRAESVSGDLGRRFPKRNTLLKILSKQINTGRELGDLLVEEWPQYADFEDAIRKIGVRYAERKQRQGVMDYDDLLVQLDRLLVEHPDRRERLASACRHVLVDEYQDTNRVQARIAGLLASATGNLMVVGDEAQSIYAFRGATVDNILSFPDVFQGAQRTVLDVNYRSVQPVLDLANAVLRSCTRGFDKALKSTLHGGDKPALVDVLDGHEQADAVVAQILALREEGFDLSSQAVLFRSGHHAHLVELALAEADVPFRKYGGMRFVEAAHIKDVVSLLRLVANPRDVLAWSRVLPWMEGVGAKTAATIAESVVVAEPPVLDPEPYKKKRYGGDLVELARMLAVAAEVRDDVPALLQVVVPWYTERLKVIYEDWKKRIKDLDTLDLVAERQPVLDDFLGELALDPIEEDAVAGPADDEDDILTLSTIHSAKGLEWDVVYLLELSDGAFPSGYALREDADLDEERRLLYVAVTRARRGLYLMRPRLSGPRWGGDALAPGCTLLDDIPDLDALTVNARAGRPARPKLAEARSTPAEVEDWVRRLLER